MAKFDLENFIKENKKLYKDIENALSKQLQDGLESLNDDDVINVVVNYSGTQTRTTQIDNMAFKSKAIADKINAALKGASQKRGQLRISFTGSELKEEKLLMTSTNISAAIGGYFEYWVDRYLVVKIYDYLEKEGASRATKREISLRDDKKKSTFFAQGSRDVGALEEEVKAVAYDAANQIFEKFKDDPQFKSELERMVP